MKTSIRRLIGGFATAAILLSGQSGLTHAASPSPSPIPRPPAGPTGDEMLSVLPALVSVAAKPGETTTTKLTVRAAADLAVTIRARGLGQAVDGSFAALSPDEDTGGFSARSMITASPTSIQIKPGDVITVDLNIAVPADAGEGTRYGILTITGMPPNPGNSGNVGFGVELGVSAIVQIANTPQNRTGEISAIDVGDALPGEPLPVDIGFLNTGNTHYGARPNELLTTATLQDMSGTVLARASAPGNELSLIPGFTRKVPLQMASSKAFVDGATYRIEVGVGLKDGTVLDRRTLEFTWSAGAALRPTAAPTQPPAVAAPVAPQNDISLMIAVGVGSALLVALLFFVIARLRRRTRQEAGAAPK